MPAEAWEDFDTTIGELAGDSAITSRSSEPDTGDDDLDDEPVDHRRQQAIVRRARRHWVLGYADNAHRENRDRIRHNTQPPRSSLSALSWLAVIRLSLVFYTAGNWTDDDEGPHPAPRPAAHQPAGGCRGRRQPARRDRRFGRGHCRQCPAARRDRCDQPSRSRRPPRRRHLPDLAHHPPASA